MWTTSKNKRTICLGCGKHVTNKPTLDCSKSRHAEYYEKHHGRAIWQRLKFRESALQILVDFWNVPLRCMVNGCSVEDVRILNINHLLGASNLRKRNLYRAIRERRIDLSKLDVRCCNHNALYEYEIGRAQVSAEKRKEIK